MINDYNFVVVMSLHYLFIFSVVECESDTLSGTTETSQV